MKAVGTALFCWALLLGCRGEPVPAEPAVETPTVPRDVEPRQPAAFDCGSDSMVLEVVEGEGTESLTVEPDFGLGEAEVVWRQDLNGDDHDDLALRFPDAAGNWGDCPVAVLAACADGRYLPVWGPDYVVDLEMAESSSEWEGRSWRHLATIDRQGDDVSSRVLRFESGRYRNRR